MYSCEEKFLAAVSWLPADFRICKAVGFKISAIILRSIL